MALVELTPFTGGTNGRVERWLKSRSGSLMTMFKRRIGLDPHGREGVRTPNLHNCPDIWELDNGDFAVIGLRKTGVLRANLPDGANCGPDEEIVVLPRSVLTSARSDIPVA